MPTTFLKRQQKTGKNIRLQTPIPNKSSSFSSQPNIGEKSVLHFSWATCYLKYFNLKQIYVLAFLSNLVIALETVLGDPKDTVKFHQLLSQRVGSIQVSGSVWIQAVLQISYAEIFFSKKGFGRYRLTLFKSNSKTSHTPWRNFEQKSYVKISVEIHSTHEYLLVISQSYSYHHQRPLDNWRSTPPQLKLSRTQTSNPSRGAFSCP